MFTTPTLADCSQSTYACPACGAEKEVNEFYDYLLKMRFPLEFEEAVCVCGVSMERKTI